MTVLLQDAAGPPGTFMARTYSVSGGQQIADQIAIANVNGDGYLDIIVSTGRRSRL